MSILLQKCFGLLAIMLLACEQEPATPGSRPARVSPYQIAVGHEPTPRAGPSTCLAALSLTDPTAALPDRLSETGCFTNLIGWRPAAHVTWYDVQSPLYADGSGKERFLSVPENKQVEFIDGRLWFPAGTALIKVFALPLATGVTQTVEVRFVFHGDGIWRFFTYRWNTEKQDGHLLTDHDKADYHVRAADGARVLSYTFPSPAECKQCHSDATDIVLGARVEQLNGQRIYPSGTATQTAKLETAGYLATLPAEVSAALWPDPADTGPELAARARSYLAANCSHCHRPGGFSSPGLTLDLRYDRSLPDTHLCDAAQFDAPKRARRLVAGHPNESWLHNRMTRIDEYRMSPWRTLPDTFGVALIDEWIRGLARCP